MRIGLMIPAVNTVAEEEFHLGTPTQVQVHTARMYIAGTASSHVLEMIGDGLPRAVRDIATVHPDVVVLGCTSVGAVLGVERERTLVQEIEADTGAPVVSMNDAVHRALERVAAKRVAVLTPYPEDVTQRIAEGMRALGLEVPATAAMGIETPFQIAAVEPAEIMELAARHVPGSGADTLFLACGNLRTREVRDALSEEFGVSVVSSNQAALDQALEYTSIVA